MKIAVKSTDELREVAQYVHRLILDGYRLFLLSGDLGSGKTTFVQVLCRELGVTESISSPTFSLVNAYESPRLGIIYHMDLYRIEKAGNLVQIGLEEYLESGQVCLIEWPAIADDYFYPPFVKIQIEMDTGNIRNFKITTHDAVDA